MKELISTVSPDSILADTPDCEPVRIDFEQLIGEHTLIAAKTGFGKTVLARKIKELGLAAGYPMVVLDSVGAFASLREAAPNGILVAGGAHGDAGVTIEEAIRRLPQIVNARASIVIDISGVDDAGQALVVARVLSVMMKLPEYLQQPYLVSIDEVQRFAPQRGSSKALDPLIKVAKEGRKHGITLLVASQRLADISKGLTSQMTNRLFGHVSDLADRKRIGEEIGISPREAMALSEFDRGDFLVRGEAFGGSLDRVRIRKPLTGKLGKNDMIEKLRLPISPIDEVHALFGAAAASAPASTATRWGSISSPSPVRPLPIQQLTKILPDEDDDMESVLLELLVSFGRGGIEKDSLALLAGTTERRGSFQAALSDLLARKLVSVGTGAKVRITPQGTASLGADRQSKSTIAVLAGLRAAREPVDERVIACLSASGHVPLAVNEIQVRTGLGPRVLKNALKRLKRDCWIVERRGSYASSSALAQLIGR